MSLRDDLAATLRIGAYASGSWEERVDALLPVIDAALTDEAMVEAVADTLWDDRRDIQLTQSRIALTAVREHLGSQR